MGYKIPFCSSNKNLGKVNFSASSKILYCNVPQSSQGGRVDPRYKGNTMGVLRIMNEVDASLRIQDPSRKFLGLMVETSHPQNRIASGKSRILRTYLDP